MPKKRTKDQPYLTASEHASGVGGWKKRRWINQQGGGEEEDQYGELPFGSCALTLLPYKTPAATVEDGMVYEYEALVKYVEAYGKSPVTGEKLEKSQILKLQMAKNEEGAWHCPVTCKTFGPRSVIVAIVPTGRVYDYSAVKEICLSTKNATCVDLIDATTRFDPKTELLKLNDPEDRKRDLSTFHHLKTERAKTLMLEAPGVRNPSKRSLEILEKAKINALRYSQTSAEEDTREKILPGATEAFVRVRALKPTAADVLQGNLQTTGASSGSFTSTSIDLQTRSELRLATDAELQEARWRELKSLKQKGYVRLETTFGPLNCEIRADCVPRAAENFLTHCSNGYYDGVLFHRIVPGFVAQTGDPDGTGGQSIWGLLNPFQDEFDPRLKHDSRGVLAMANVGQKHQNKSQFYITLAPCPHLDNKHTVFGKVVGGIQTLDAIEAVKVDPSDDHRPVGGDVALIKATVFQDPTSTADARFEDRVRKNIQSRLSHSHTTRPSAPRPSERLSSSPQSLLQPHPSGCAAAGGGGKIVSSSSQHQLQKHTTATIGKYLTKRR